MKQWSLLILSLVLIGCGGHSGGGSSTTPQTARFELLPRISGGGTPFHASFDGSLVFGDLSAGKTPILWDASGTPSTFPSSTALTMLSVSAVTTDDRVFCGSAKRADGATVPVLYRSATEIDELPLPSGTSAADGIDLSGDGKVALGADNPLSYPDPTASHRPFLVKNGVATYLPLPDGATIVMARGLSADGSTVIGLIDGKPVRWVDGGAPQAIDGLDALAAGSPIGSIDLSHVSRDGATVAGTVVLGTGLPTTGTVPFRWTASGGAQALPLAAGTTFGALRGLSADGKTVLLTAFESATQRQPSYLWTEKSGTQAVVDLFAKAGGDPATFTGVQAMAFSGSGKTIAGDAIYTDTITAQASPWRLNLP